MDHTRVSFMQGSLQEHAKVIYCQAAEITLLVCDLTPFHPQSHLWPDQPGDRGQIHAATLQAQVGPCLMGAFSPKGELFVDKAIPVKRGESGWTFVVVHPLLGHYDIAQGSELTLLVDSQRRESLSLGHTTCHLSALALNRAILPYWRKNVSEQDALGQADFDRLAIQSSQVQPFGSQERYRLGKSLRKKGLNSEQLLAELAQLEATINLQLMTWLSNGGEISRTRQGESIIDSRYWHCSLEGNRITIPCGGTHAQALSQLGRVWVELSPCEDGFSLHSHCSGTSNSVPEQARIIGEHGVVA